MTTAVARPDEDINALDIDPAALTSLCDQAREWPLPGHGSTARRFRHLSAATAADVVMGRLVEAHADAVAITRELRADLVVAGQRWGVWAAGPADSLRASRAATAGDSTRDTGGWTLTGTKFWCSGATLLTHALVDAATERGQQLFAVDLAGPGVSAFAPSWVGPGMARADTRSVSFEQTPAVPLGNPGDYLTRPGFWIGAIGVAACWHGGTVGVGRFLLTQARGRDDPHLLAHLGAVHVQLVENWSALTSAAATVDRQRGANHALLARSVRSIVERNAVDVVDRVGRALGPAPLAHDRHHATRVADLMVYVRQHHGEYDLEAIGREAAGTADPWSAF